MLRYTLWAKNLADIALSYIYIFFGIYIQLYTYVQTFTYVQNLLYYWVICGSAEQPLQAPGGRALNQPRPHPSGKIV